MCHHLAHAVEAGLRVGLELCYTIFLEFPLWRDLSDFLCQPKNTNLFHTAAGNCSSAHVIHDTITSSIDPFKIIAFLMNYLSLGD
jgi:hypothetical protein